MEVLVFASPKKGFYVPGVDGKFTARWREVVKARRRIIESISCDIGVKEVCSRMSRRFVCKRRVMTSLGIAAYLHLYRGAAVEGQGGIPPSQLREPLAIVSARKRSLGVVRLVTAKSRCF